MLRTSLIYDPYRRIWIRTSPWQFKDDHDGSNLCSEVNELQQHPIHSGKRSEQQQSNDACPSPQTSDRPRLQDSPEGKGSWFLLTFFLFLCVLSWWLNTVCFKIEAKADDVFNTFMGLLIIIFHLWRIGR